MSNEDIVFNMGGVEARDFEPLPADMYLVKVEKVVADTSKAGNPKWDLQLRVTQDHYNNRVIFDTLTFTENSLSVVKSKLLVLNPELAESTQLNFATDGEKLIGAEAIVRVAIQHNEGYAPQNRVTSYKSAEIEE